MVQFEINFISLLIPIFLILVTTLIIKKISNDRISKRYNKLNFIYLGLLIWILIGYYTGIDYSTQFGCISFEDTISSAAKTKYFSSALALLIVSYILRENKIGLLFLITELIIWLYKFLFVKGGYVSGIGGIADAEVVFYDTIAIYFRLILLFELFRLKMRLLYLLLIIILIMSFRVF